MITTTFPIWITWIFISLLGVNAFLIGIKVWYGWSLTKEQKKDRSTNEQAREARWHKEGFDHGVRYEAERRKNK